MAYFPTASSGAFQRGRSSVRTPGAHTEQMKVQGAREGSYYADLAAQMSKIASAEEMEANRLGEMERQFDEKLSEQVREFDISSEFQRDKLGAEVSLGYAGIRSRDRATDATRDIAEMNLDFAQDKLTAAQDEADRGFSLAESNIAGQNQRSQDFLKATLGQQESFLEDRAASTQTNPLLAAAAESSGPVVNETSKPRYNTFTPVGSTDYEDPSGPIDWGGTMSDDLYNF